VHVNDRYNVLCLAGLLAFSAGGGILVETIKDRVREEWFRPALEAAFIGAVFAALSIATTDTPNLPVVEINASKGAKAGVIPDCSNLPKDRTFVKVAQSSNVLCIYNDSGLFAVYIAEIQPIRYLPACTSCEPNEHNA
jgi:hypothetical protein